jgi:hypothetical protein
MQRHQPHRLAKYMMCHVDLHCFCKSCDIYPSLVRAESVPSNLARTREEQLQALVDSETRGGKRSDIGGTDGPRTYPARVRALVRRCKATGDCGASEFLFST